MSRRLFSFLTALCLVLALFPCAAVCAASAPAKPVIDRQTIAAGDNFSAVIKENGDLYTFGGNSAGQLGNGYVFNNTQYTCQTLPVKVMSGAASICAGGSNCCAITENGDVYSWGSNEFGDVGNAGKCNGTPTAACYKYQTTPVKIMSGAMSVSGANSALMPNGDLYMWGFNGSSKMGNNFAGNEKSQYTWAGNYQTTPIKVLSGAAAVTAGETTTGIIMKNGDLYMCGNNKFCQAGDNSTDEKNADGGLCKSTPVKIMSGVRSVALGYYHSGAITDSGDLYTWGLNSCGQLGDGTFTQRSTPEKILSGVKKAAFGCRCSVALLDNGDVYAWGINRFGAVGNGAKYDKDASDVSRSVPTPVKVMSGVVDISCNYETVLALLSNGDLYGWGFNISGELGIGSTEDQFSPVKIMSGVRLPSPASSPASGVIPNIAIDGAMVSFNSDYGWPYIDKASRTMVPFAVTMKTYGVNVSWDNSTKTASAYNDAVRVDVPIGQKYIVVNGVKQSIDTSAQIVNSRTYLPISAVLQAFGATVKWDGTARIVDVSRPKA